MEHPWTTLPFLDETLKLGTCNGRNLLIGTTGLGKVNAAITTAAILEHFRADQVWNIGCAGAYKGSPLKVGDVLITETSLCGDEGILTQAGPLSARGLRIPILSRDGMPYFDHIPPCRDSVLEQLYQATPPGPYKMGKEMVPMPAVPCPSQDLKADPPDSSELFRLFYGPSLTVGMVSGEKEVASQRFLYHDALAENMEGSAVAQTCFRFNVPMAECRGISNEAGDRRKEYWRMDLALSHCHAIVLHWLKVLGLWGNRGMGG
jgi:futalosine hydrolase